MPLGFWFVTGETRRAFATLYLLLRERWIVGSFQPTLCTPVCLPLPVLYPLPRVPFPLAPDLHLDTPRPAVGREGVRDSGCPGDQRQAQEKCWESWLVAARSVCRWSRNSCTKKDSPVPSVLLPGTWFGGNWGL